ncbi:LYR motif-containing protein 9-like [Arctopsyche grandis]|uniref:LYR motif-containing protein 9-like n=1 Tax=Arctopsyche grandis TaxID=121162 RepID=UPI00406D9440
MLISKTLLCSIKQPPMNSLQLYKYLLRQCDKLPKDAQQFYKHTVRQNYKQHILESDTERVNSMIIKTLEDAKWILKKYINQEKT